LSVCVCVSVVGVSAVPHYWIATVSCLNPRRVAIVEGPYG